MKKHRRRVSMVPLGGRQAGGWGRCSGCRCKLGDFRCRVTVGEKKGISFCMECTVALGIMPALK